MMRAIDLYSGIGGWHLGFKMAGIDIVASYEWWEQANRTYRNNFSKEAICIDIRRMPLKDLPDDLDIVVGSPPCTQFSFANRGGSGDITDGLRDIYKFLEVVEYISPKYWAMENVPRVASILERELSKGGVLERFKDIVPVITVVNMVDYGLPQSRKRMIAGNFPLPLLDSYKGQFQPPTLGEIIESLNRRKATDLLYGISLNRSGLTENEEEPPLDWEETRMNREAKTHHPVYNRMSFPDRLDKASRTITATCTRVSRESIIIRVPERKGKYRRLTVRERASLQGFPLTFQFYGDTYSDKLKMIGNAFPPIMSYHIAHCMIGTKPEEVKHPKDCRYKNPLPKIAPKLTLTPQNKSYPPNRKFRSAIPNLRFGSGVRFELVNQFNGGSIEWLTNFYYGTSKQIKTVLLDEQLYGQLSALDGFKYCEERLNNFSKELTIRMQDITPSRLQMTWSHRTNGFHPYKLVDFLGGIAKELHKALPEENLEEIEVFVLKQLNKEPQANLRKNGSKKTKEIASWIFIGFLIGCWFNTQFEFRETDGDSS